MDIDEFANGLQPYEPTKNDPDRDQRLAHATAEHTESPYLAQAKKLALAGRAFEDHYWHLLPSYFDSNNLSFAKHCLLNFAVQQLSIRALNQPKQNCYLYIGESPEDLAASLICAPPFLQVTWVRKESGSAEAHARVLQLLAHGRADDLQVVTLDTKHAENPFFNQSEKSCGLIVLESPNMEGSSISSILSHAMPCISVGGTLIIYLRDCPIDVTLPNLTVRTVRIPSDLPDFPNTALIVRSAT